MTDKDLEKGNLEEEVKETEIPADAEEATEEAAAEETTAEEVEAETAEGGKEAKKEKKGFFSKKKDPRDTQIEELTDRLKRSMAEFDNFRKRTEKEKSAMYEIGAKDVIMKILPVVDNFERGLAAVPEDVKGTPFEDGMEKIYKQLMKTLDDMGVKPIEAVGKEFDPNFHNAVMHTDDENLGENVVAEEFQKGYTYRDSVIRHSMVKVAN
ncbi:MAG: nucleotide exchange factor GrpE [Lachnospiraceae bacterium]|nr:nucleotide exchange factor GrpE [Lachnospiraceae bacterium]